MQTNMKLYLTLEEGEQKVEREVLIDPENPYKNYEALVLDMIDSMVVDQIKNHEEPIK